MNTSDVREPDQGAAAWHALPVEAVVERLGARPGEGFDSAEAARRMQQYGPNMLPLGKQQTSLMRFLGQFNNVLVYVLIGAGVLKLAFGLWLDTAIIFSVVFLNSLLGFLQEGKAAKALESISKMLSAEARTLREGALRMIAADTLVPGDIVLLESGDKVPADLRLLEAKNLRTEEAALTGESVPAEKNIDPVECERHGRRPGMYGLLGHDGGVGSGHRVSWYPPVAIPNSAASTHCSPA